MTYQEIYNARQAIGTNQRAIYSLHSNKCFDDIAAKVSGSVLDVGCGFGTLKEKLVNCTYTGIDGTPWIAEASGNTCCDIMDYHGPKHDWVIALGVSQNTDDLTVLANKIKKLASVGFIIDYHDFVMPIFKSYTEKEIRTAFGVVEITPWHDHRQFMVYGRKIDG